MSRFLLIKIITSLLIITYGASAREEFSFGGDQEALESGDGSIKIAQPITFGGAIQAEVQRLQSLQAAFPPKDKSYFIPYGDRTALALQFPNVSPSDINTNNINQNAGYGGGGGGYGPPKPVYGPPKKQSKPLDFGVLLSQNFVYRENIRDYNKFSQLFKNTRPAQELLTQFAKDFSQRNKNGDRGAIHTALSNLLNLGKSTGGYSGGYGGYSEKKNETPAFILVAIESRMKTDSPLNANVTNFPGFDNSLSTLTNGSVIFPSPSDPEVLTFVPFILRQPGDMSHVFDGSEEESYGQGLVPQEKKEILRFMKLVEGIHEDVHGEGKDRVKKVRELSKKLERPRLMVNAYLVQDSMEVQEEEERVRGVHWLYTSTVAVRTLTPQPEEEPQGQPWGTQEYVSVNMAPPGQPQGYSSQPLPSSQTGYSTAG